MPLVGVLGSGALPAEELHPELRLAPLDTVQPDITRRPEEARTVTVRSRPRPELAPLGMRLRSFMLLPSLEWRNGFNDNLRATEDDEISDIYTVLAPKVELRSDWSRHALKFGADAASARHQDITTENYDDWKAFTEGRLDFGRASTVFGRASFADMHETRASPESSTGRELATYQVSETSGGWSHGFGRFDVRLTGTLTDYNFDTVDESLLPPDTLSGDDRDRQSRRGEGRLRYQVWPGYGAFIRTAYTEQDYESLAPNGTDRDSTGYEASVGMDFEVTDLILGNAFIGYYEQRYEAADFDDTSGLGFGAELSWNPTTLTTVQLKARRSVQESILPGASGYLSTDFMLDLDHELLRNLLLTGGIQVTHRDYQETGISEVLTQHHLGMNYMLNRHIYLRLRVVHRVQDGTNGGRDYTQNLLEQSIVLQY